MHANNDVCIYGPSKYHICMTTQAAITSYLSTPEAAELLGLSAHQIGALARAGELSAIQSAGRALMVTAESVKAYQQLRQGKGRPLSEKIAFAAFFALSGIETKELTYQQQRRLAIKLSNISAEDLVWQARKRSNTRRYRCRISFFQDLSNEMVLSGLSALDGNFDLTADSSILEGYMERKDLDDLVERYFLEEDSQGNVVVHVSESLPCKDARMPVGVVAADLATSLNTREHGAGLSKIKELLDDCRCLQHQ